MIIINSVASKSNTTAPVKRQDRNSNKECKDKVATCDSILNFDFYTFKTLDFVRISIGHRQKKNFYIRPPTPKILENRLRIPRSFPPFLLTVGQLDHFGKNTPSFHIRTRRRNRRETVFMISKYTKKTKKKREKKREETTTKIVGHIASDMVAPLKVYQSYGSRSDPILSVGKNEKNVFDKNVYVNNFIEPSEQAAKSHG
uniref:Uncharacterized protein n=1 Tax=Romanomermis culicivorax TaxID=13658 RepID=A0A915J2P8_ROMCU